MALSTKCLRYLTLVADVLFMVLGLAAAVLQLVLVLPLISLLPLPRWLLPPLLLPLLPTLLAIPAGFVAFNVTRGERRWRLGGVVALQALAALAMAVLAGWSVSLWFSHRIETDLTALMNESLVDAKWHTVYHELQCCGPAGPTSFQGSSGIPSACCSREAGAAGEGPCSRLYSQGCVAPASDRIRGVLRDGAASQGGTALLMFICALSTAFFADALRRSHKKQREQQLAQEDKPLRTPILNQNQRY